MVLMQNKTEELREKMAKVGFDNCESISGAECKAYQLLFESDACSWCGTDQILKACKEAGLVFVRMSAAEYKDGEIWRPVEPIEVE